MKDNLFTLFKNFVETQADVDGVYLFSKEGGLIVRFDAIEPDNKGKEHQIDKIGKRFEILEELIEKINDRFKVGFYGTGSFDTPDNRILYLEVGFEAVILIVCDFYINLDQLFPLAYLLAEKVAQILEGSFSPKYHSLSIPNLKFHKNFSLGLKSHEIESDKPIFDSVYQKMHVKREDIRRRIYKIIVLGAAEVGKTTLINSFLKNEQTGDYRPTIGISISHKTFSIQGFGEDSISLMIYDLAGQKFFKRARLEYYAGANCAIIVYDITRPETFEEAINYWYEDVRKQLGKIPIALIGNKIDLDQERKVSSEQGQEKADEIESIFAETSALENTNVQDAFNIIGIELFFKTQTE